MKFLIITFCFISSISYSQIHIDGHDITSLNIRGLSYDSYNDVHYDDPYIGFYFDSRIISFKERYVYLIKNDATWEYFRVINMFLVIDCGEADKILDVYPDILKEKEKVSSFELEPYIKRDEARVERWFYAGWYSDKILTYRKVCLIWENVGDSSTAISVKVFVR